MLPIRAIKTDREETKTFFERHEIISKEGYHVLTFLLQLLNYMLKQPVTKAQN